MNIQTQPRQQQPGQQNRQKNLKNQLKTPLDSIYIKNKLTRKVILKINEIGKNIKQILENKIKEQYEGKCSNEGFIKSESVQITTYSSGRPLPVNDYISFDVCMEAQVCFLVEGMLLSCRITNITKAGITAESATDIPSPVKVFVTKDNHYDNERFSTLNIGDKIVVSVIGQKFQLNDPFICVTAYLVRSQNLFLGNES